MNEKEEGGRKYTIVIRITYILQLFHIQLGIANNQFKLLKSIFQFFSLS